MSGSGRRRRRLRPRRRLPRDPVHAAGLRCSIIFGKNVTGRDAGLRSRTVSDRLRHCGCARGTGRARHSTRARCSTTRGRVHRQDRALPVGRHRVSDRSRASAAIARSSLSTTPTATAGCCRRSRRGCPDGCRSPRRTGRRATWHEAMRRAAAAHGEHEAPDGRGRPQLAGLVRGIHGARAGRRRHPEMTRTLRARRA